MYKEGDMHGVRVVYMYEEGDITSTGKTGKHPKSTTYNRQHMLTSLCNDVLHVHVCVKIAFCRWMLVPITVMLEGRVLITKGS